MPARKRAVKRKTKTTKTRSAVPAARPSYFDPSQLLLKVAPQRSAPRTLSERLARAQVGPAGAVTLLQETVRGAPEGVDRWTVVVSPDTTCAFAYSGQQLYDEEQTQRLTHWAVVWSEPPAKHTMWAGHWARLTRVRKGSTELRQEGGLCRVCKTRDAEKCEGIRRARLALTTALGALHG